MKAGVVVMAGIALVVVVATWFFVTGIQLRQSPHPLTAQEKADAPVLRDGVIHFCGQTLPSPPPYQPPAGLRRIVVGLEPLERGDARSVVISISTADQYGRRCLDEAVEAPISIILSCNPPAAPVWTDWSAQRWQRRVERPEDGVVVLEGHSAGFLEGFVFIPMPALGYRPDEFPFQGMCFSEPGVGRHSDRCKSNYMKGRMAVRYSYAASSIRAWRQVDDLVRDTVDGRPITGICPK